MRNQVETALNVVETEKFSTIATVPLLPALKRPMALGRLLALVRSHAPRRHLAVE